MPYNLYIRPGRKVKLRWFSPIRSSGVGPAKTQEWRNCEWLEGYFEERSGVVADILLNEADGEIHRIRLEGDDTYYPMAHVVETHVR
jgi:hypothetical protein